MFSKQGTELGKLLLKYHHKSHQQQQQTSIVDTQSTKKPQQSFATQRSNKYSNDYTQFQKLAQKLQDQKKPIDNKPQASSSNPTEYFAHTHDKRKQRELYERSTQQKLQNAEYFKNQGNKAYSEQEFQKASYCYQKALVHFDYTFPDTEKEEKTMISLQEKCHQNMGLCLYKLNEKQEAIFHLKQTLKYNSKNIKALYTLSKVFLDADDYQKCQFYVNEVKNFAPQNKEIEGVLCDLRKKMQRYSQKTKKMSEMMLAK